MRRSVLLLAGLVLAGCDGPSGPDVGPPSALTRGTLPSDLVVGQTLDSVRVAVEDDQGRSVGGVTVRWVAETGSVPSSTSMTNDGGVAVTSWTLGTTPGQQTLTAEVEGLAPATFAGFASAGPVIAVVNDVGQASLHAILDTVFVVARSEDEYGNDTGSTITWSSTDAGVASVNGGVVVARAEGAADIIAATNGLADTTAIQVTQVAAGLSVTGPYTVLALNEAWDYQATAVDSNGYAMTSTGAVTWGSTDPNVITVDNGGRVTAAGTGTADLTAASGTYSGALTLEVRAGPRASITSVTPDTLLAGDTIVVDGTGFSGVQSENRVSVAGVDGTVLASTSTQITVALAAPDAYPCGPRAPRDVVVDVNGLEARTEKIVALAPRIALAVGASTARFGADVDCFELTRNGTYAVSVFNAVNSAAATTAFQLRGTGATTAMAAPGSLAAAAPRTLLRIPATAPQIRSDPEDAAHLGLLEENLRLAEEWARSRRRSGAPMLRSMAAEPVPTVGELRSFRIPDLDSNSLCADYITVTARAVHVGAHGVVWEDTVAPFAGTMDPTWQTMGQEFDTHMYDVLLENFGDPLVYDAQLDANGRFFMLFSDEINDLERNVAGFVFAGDMVPRAECASSDRAEIFYGVVPTETGSGFDGNTVDAWFRSMRSTVIHEVKHITSFAHKFSNNATFEETWLEESTARLSEELYARRVYGYGQGGNIDYATSIYCEVRPSSNECVNSPPWVMGKHFLAVMDYYGNIEGLTPLGSANQDDFTYYGSGWLFVRWAIDQSSLAEPDFVKALINETSLTGMDNITARTGRSFREMLADFSLAIAVDDHPQGVMPANAALAFPTWDVRDVMGGFNIDFPDSFPDAFPLDQHQVSFGDFTVAVAALRGGTASLFRISGTMQGSQLLELLDASGGPAPNGLGIAVVRVQ